MDGPLPFAELVRSWSTKCSRCGEPCEGSDVKELALGYVMHLGCYDKWLKSQDEGPEAYIQRFAITEKLRFRMAEWMASARWKRG